MNEEKKTIKQTEIIDTIKEEEIADTLKEYKKFRESQKKKIMRMITLQFILDIIFLLLFVFILYIFCNVTSAEYVKADPVITYTEASSESIEAHTTPTIYISVKPTEPHLEASDLTEPIDNTPTVPPTPPVDEHDAELLAMVIYQEVGSDAICDDCRRRVADVVLNRVESDMFPDTIEEVLTEPYAYGRYAWTGVSWPSRASYDSEAHAVERARRIAREVLEGKHSELYGNGYVFQAGFAQGSEGFWCCGVYYGKIS